MKLIFERNSELGTSLGELVDGFKPSFRRGPRYRQTVKWVAEVKPTALYHSITVCKWLYIGFMSCKIGDFTATIWCTKCQKYGDNATHCKTVDERCAKGSAKGHNSKLCTLTTLSDANATTVDARASQLTTKVVPQGLGPGSEH